MIELIFAIVVIGITLMSVPNLIDRASESSYTTMQQEAIAFASSQFSLLLSDEWDENDNNATCDEPLTVTNGDPKLNSRAGAQWRNYSDAPSNCLPLLAATPIGFDVDDSGSRDDIDDWNNNNSTLVNRGATDPMTGEIVDFLIKIRSNIDYIDDSPTSGDYNTSSSIVFNFNTVADTPTTNIKAISTTLTTTNTVTKLEKTIILRAFACNIGTYEPAGVPKW